MYHLSESDNFFLWEVTHCEQWDFCLQNREGGGKMHGMIWCEIGKGRTSKKDGMWFKGELVKRLKIWECGWDGERLQWWEGEIVTGWDS